MYVPNIITITRLFLVPVIIWLIVADKPFTAFVVFLVAGLTDALDGFLARRFGWQTELGAYLDAIADKALLMSVYAALGFYGFLPAWLVILVVSRDILIIGAVILGWLLDRAMALHPQRLSKVNTALQIGLAVLVLAERGLAAWLGRIYCRARLGDRRAPRRFRRCSISSAGCGTWRAMILMTGAGRPARKPAAHFESSCDMAFGRCRQ